MQDDREWNGRGRLSGNGAVRVDRGMSLAIAGLHRLNPLCAVRTQRARQMPADDWRECCTRSGHQSTIRSNDYVALVADKSLSYSFFTTE